MSANEVSTGKICWDVLSEEAFIKYRELPSGSPEAIVMRNLVQMSFDTFDKQSPNIKRGVE
jgi:hypothetical protein